MGNSMRDLAEQEGDGRLRNRRRDRLEQEGRETGEDMF